MHRSGRVSAAQCATADAAVDRLLGRFDGIASISGTKRSVAPIRSRALLKVLDSTGLAIGPQLTPLRTAARAHVLFTPTVLRHCVFVKLIGLRTMSAAELGAVAIPGTSRCVLNRIKSTQTIMF